MFFLGISLVEFADLPSHFQNLAIAYEPDKQTPGPFWAVFFNGKILSIYLMPLEALTHMLRVKAEFEEGIEPKVQTMDNVKLKRDVERTIAKVAENIPSSPSARE